VGWNGQVRHPDRLPAPQALPLGLSCSKLICFCLCAQVKDGREGPTHETNVLLCRDGHVSTIGGKIIFQMEVCWTEVFFLCAA